MIEVTALALAGHPFLRGMQGTRTRLIAGSMSDGA